MKLLTGNAFDDHGQCAVCITTNGFVGAKKAVMGKGIALTVAKMIPEIPVQLNRQMRLAGNIVQIIGVEDVGPFVAFPVKPVEAPYRKDTDIVKHMRNRFQRGSSVPGWACVADIEIIERSCHELVALTDTMKWKKVLVPRPGCGAGELEWEEVRTVIEPILDDRFYVISL